MTLGGHFTVNFFDEKTGQHIRRIETPNVITDKGLEYLGSMLTDIYSADRYPSVLRNHQDFSNARGDVWGIVRADEAFTQEQRSKSTWTVHDWVDRNYNENHAGRAMDEYVDTHETWNGGYNESTTNWEDRKYYLDLGWTPHEENAINIPASGIGVAQTLPYMNLHGGDVKLFNAARTFEYTRDTHYTFDPGDYETYGSFTLTDIGLADTDLSLDYYQYDVPPIEFCAMSIIPGSTSDGWYWNTGVHGVQFSYDQGVTWGDVMLPNYPGYPRLGSLYNRYGHSSMEWHPHMQSYEHFLNFFPYLIKSPTSMKWTIWNDDQDVHINDIRFYTFRFPKIGPRGIALGNGSGSPSSSDTALFNEIGRKVSVSAYNNNTYSEFRISVVLDGDELNGTEFTEAGLLFTDDENVYANGDSVGVQMVNATGGNYCKKIAPLEDATKLNKLGAHSMFSSPWTKSAGERVEVSYVLNLTWA